MSHRGVHLTFRDQAMLAALDRYRILTAAQLQRLHFSSKDTCLRRIRRLETGGFIARRRSLTIPHRLIHLTGRGRELLGQCSARSCGELSELFLQHTIAVNDFRIALELSCATTADMRLAGFIPDLATRFTQAGAQPKRVLGESLKSGLIGSHTPDAAFALERGERAALFFLEIDRGSEVVGDTKRGVGRAVEAYLRALQDNTAGGLYTLFGLQEPFPTFRVLFVTTSRRRIDNIRRGWGRSASSHAERFIWLAPMEVSSSGNLFHEEWCSLSISDERRYTIVPRETGVCA